MILGTIGVFAGIAGGVVAGVVAPRFPFGHAALFLFLALDTASVLAKGTDPLGSISPEAAFSSWRSVWWLDHRPNGKATHGRFGSSSIVSSSCMSEEGETTEG